MDGALHAALPSRLGRWALGAAVLGVTCLPVLGSTAAVVLGALALRRRARGRPEGVLTSSIAVALGVAGWVLAAAAVRSLLAVRRGPAVVVPSSTVTAVRPAPPAAPAPSERPAQAAPAARASRDTGRIELTLGPLRLVDLPDGGALRELLQAESGDATRAGEQLVLFTVADDCQPCNGVAVALADARLQRALGRARLVRVHVDDRTVELQRLGVPVDKVPGFALLGPDALARDYVNGGEWGADLAENIAPVLGPFLQGKLERRRSPFRSPATRDLTTL